MARHILVTGGAGYIGSHTSKASAAAGYTPVAYDNLVYRHRWAVRWGPLIVADLVDAELLQRVLCDYQVADDDSAAEVHSSVLSGWTSAAGRYNPPLQKGYKSVFLDVDREDGVVAGRNRRKCFTVSYVPLRCLSPWLATTGSRLGGVLLSYRTLARKEKP